MQGSVGRQLVVKHKRNRPATTGHRSHNTGFILHDYVARRHIIEIDPGCKDGDINGVTVNADQRSGLVGEVRKKQGVGGFHESVNMNEGGWGIGEGCQLQAIANATS